MEVPGRKPNIKLRQFSTCNTSWVIYLLIHKCLLLYVGKTEITLKLIVLEHCPRIRLKVMDNPLIAHSTAMNDKETDFKLTILYVADKKRFEYRFIEKGISLDFQIIIF